MPHIRGHLPRPFNPGDRRLIGMGAFDPGLAARPIRRPLPPFLSVNDRLSPINTPEANVSLGADPSLRQFHPLFRQKPISGEGLLSQNNRFTLFNTPAQDFRSPVDFQDYKPTGLSAISSYIQRHGSPQFRDYGPTPAGRSSASERPFNLTPGLAGTTHSNGLYQGELGITPERAGMLIHGATGESQQNSQAPSGAQGSGEPTVAELIARLNPEQTPQNPLARPVGQKLRPTQMPQTGSIAGPQLEVGAGMPDQIDQIDVPETDFNAGQPGFLDKIGGFFKRPGMQDALLAAGAAMMSGRDAQGNAYTDPLQGIGAGLTAGAQAYKADELDRRVEEDRGVLEQRREQAETSIRALMKGRTDEEIAAVMAISAAGTPEALAAAVQLAREYADDQKLRTVFGQGEGRYLTPEQLEIATIYEGDERANYLAGIDQTEGRAAAIRSIRPDLDDDVVEMIASSGERVTDRFMSRNDGYVVVESGNGMSRLVDTRYGAEDPIGDPFGEVDINIGNIALQREQLTQEGLGGVYDEIQDEYRALRPQLFGLKNFEDAILKLEEGNAYVGWLGGWQTRLGEVFDGERAATTQELQNIFLDLGFGSLQDLKGSISDKDLELALKRAGETGDLRSALMDLMQKRQAGIRTQLNAHNERVDRLEQYNLPEWDSWKLQEADVERWSGRSTGRVDPTSVTVVDAEGTR